MNDIVNAGADRCHSSFGSFGSFRSLGSFGSLGSLRSLESFLEHAQPHNRASI